MSKKPGPAVRPFGLWDSSISVASIFDQPSQPMYPFRYDNVLYWLQSLPDQGGRISLMRQNMGRVECLTPEEFNIRSKVHEYGGRCHCLCGDMFVFNNFSDGKLYRQSLEPSAQPELICEQQKSILGYADLVYLPRFNAVVAVAEQSHSTNENKNYLIAVGLNEQNNSIAELIVGADFYAAPVVNRDCDQLAWFEWDHPHMPWDQSRLCLANIIKEIDSFTLGNVGHVVKHDNQSVCQPGFVGDGGLIYASDCTSNNWWNLFCTKEGNIQQITHENKEFGEAHWVFGQHRWAEIDHKNLIAIATSAEGDALYKVAMDSETPLQLLFESACISHLSFQKDELLFVETPQSGCSRIMQYLLQSDQISVVGPEFGQSQNAEYSVAQSVCFPTKDGERSWAYYYPPQNADFIAPEATFPPLIVMVHGGPTSRSNTAYNPLKQYFTALGFAIADVNHRGSTGYGRLYRQRLQGNWGEIDTMDIADAIEYFVDKGQAANDAIFIRGGSAGGYAVLRALTKYADLFAGGACYYGIGNLITLSEITHKFESRYTDQLVGEEFDPVNSRNENSLFWQRSPIFAMDQLRSPLILFQGLLDKVVPPKVSRELVKVLKLRDIRYGYTEYDTEGHGFRQTATRIDSLQKEATFFREVINERLTQ